MKAGGRRCLGNVLIESQRTQVTNSIATTVADRRSALQFHVVVNRRSLTIPPEARHTVGHFEEVLPPIAQQK